MHELLQRYGVGTGLAVGALVLALVASPSVARAQPADATSSALARRLFLEAVELNNGGDHAGAVERYRRVMELRPSPAVRWNLAHALVELGEFVEATELLEHVRRDGEASAGVRESAEALAASVRGRIGHLTLRLEGDRTRVELELDGRPLPTAALGMATPVDPGPHELRVLRDGEVVVSGSREVAEGETAELTLDVPVAPPLTPEAAAQTVALDGSGEARIPLEESGGDIAESGWFWLGMFALVAAAVAVPLVVWFTLVEPPGQPALEGDLMPGRLEFGL